MYATGVTGRSDRYAAASAPIAERDIAATAPAVPNAAWRSANDSPPQGMPAMTSKPTVTGFTVRSLDQGNTPDADRGNDSIYEKGGAFTRRRGSGAWGVTTCTTVVFAKGGPGRYSARSDPTHLHPCQNRADKSKVSSLPHGGRDQVRDPGAHLQGCSSRTWVCVALHAPSLCATVTTIATVVQVPSCEILDVTKGGGAALASPGGHALAACLIKPTNGAQGAAYPSSVGDLLTRPFLPVHDRKVELVGDSRRWGVGGGERPSRTAARCTGSRL